MKRLLMTSVVGAALAVSSVAGAASAQAGKEAIHHPMGKEAIHRPMGKEAIHRPMGKEAIHRPMGKEAIRVPLGCAPYPASVYTRTSEHVRHARVHRGRYDSVTVFVTARGTSRAPRGSVIVRAAGRVRTASVHHGVATVRLPTGRLGYHLVHASYHPANCSRFKGSSSGYRSYRVIKRKHHHHHH